jgi:hypothetical protein
MVALAVPALTAEPWGAAAQGRRGHIDPSAYGRCRAPPSRARSYGGASIRRGSSACSQRTTTSSLLGPSARSCSWARAGASDPRVRAPLPDPARPLRGHEAHACFGRPATVFVPNQPGDPEGAELGHATSAGGHVGQQTSDRSSARLQTSCKCVGPSPQTSRKHPTAETVLLMRAPRGPRMRADPLRLGQALGDLIDNALRYGATTVEVGGMQW